MKCILKSAIAFAILVIFEVCFIGNCAETTTNHFTRVLNSPGQNIGSGDVITSLIRLMGAFVFVMALFFTAAWLFKNRSNIFSVPDKKSALRIIEVKHIGGRQALIVAGYGKERVLIGATPDNINFICKLPDGDETDDKNEHEMANNNFLTLLKNTLKTK